MEAQRYRQVKEIVAILLSTDSFRRVHRLTELCGADQDLRQEVESLLKANDAAQDFLLELPSTQTLGGTGSATVALAAEGQRFGPYRIVRQIGSGGMGVVYEAVREDEFRKKVAIKVVKPGMDTAYILSRFHSERRISAALNHPNITMLLDGGATPDHRPYFTMEYVEGVPIDTYCKNHALALPQTLELFRTVCGAVHYAHQNLVVHRDLKPSNILVTNEGVPKLLDFGIAKILGPSESNGTVAGMTAAFPMMTPDYASPEQARGEAVTTATDIYSLGAVLYELLTGRRPHRFSTNTPQQIQQVICEQEPILPSEATGNRRLGGDLDNIVLMAMQKEPARRYSSAEELSQDVHRYLAGMPVRARKDTAGYRAGKFVRRHKAGVIAASLVVVALAGGIISTTRQAQIASLERDKADQQRQEAQRQEQEALRQHQEADRSKDEAQKRAAEAEVQRAKAEQQSSRADEESYRANLSAAHLLNGENEYDAARERLFSAPPGLRGWAWHHLFQRSDNSIAKLFAEADEQDSTLGANHFRSSFAFAPDTSKILWTMYSTVHSWDSRFAPGAVRAGFGRIAAISGDGSRIVAVPRSGGGKTAIIYEAATGRQLMVFAAHSSSITSAAIARNGRWVVTGDQSGELRAWDMETGRQQSVMRQPDRPVRCVSINGDGTRVAAGAPTDPAFKIYDPASGRTTAVLVGHKSPCKASAFSHTGDQLATASGDTTVWLWDARTGQSINTLLGHTGAVNAVAFSPDGRHIATASMDRSVRLWDVAEGYQLHTFTGGSEDVYVQAVAFTPDGTRVLSGGGAGEILVWRMPLFIPAVTFSADVTADESTVVSVTNIGVTVWDQQTNRQIASWPIGGYGATVKLSPDGRRIAAGTFDGRVTLWDRNSRKLLRTFTGHTAAVRSVAFSPDGRLLASGSQDKTLRVWDTVSGREVGKRELPNIVSCVRFSPDGRSLATASGDLYTLYGNGPPVHIWRISDLSLIWSLRTKASYQPSARSVVFSRDGARLAAGEQTSTDPAIWVWDTRTGRALASLKGHSRGVDAVMFSPDAKLLYSVSPDSTFRVWDLDRSELLLKYQVPRCDSDTAYYDLLTNPDGSRISTIGYCIGAATMQVWDTKSHYPPAAVEVVDRMQKQHSLLSDQIRGLQSESRLDAKTRTEALRLLEVSGSHRIDFREHVLAPLLHRQQTTSVSAGALRQAQMAALRAPYSALYLMAVALGHYRTGAYDEAIKTIQRAAAIGEVTPEHLLVQAAAESRLSKTAQARQTLEEAGRLRGEFAWNNTDSYWVAFRTEVEGLIQGKEH